LNIPAPSASVEVSTPYTDFTLNVENLEPLTSYTAYIVGGSAHPGYPDLMSQSSVIAIQFTTSEPPKSNF